MDYEKKYKEALEKARKLATDLPNGRNDRLYHIWDLENIFPELKKESEDERIRKELINYFIKGKEYLSLCSFSKEEVLTWLEKQGEQKPTIEMKSAEESLGVDSETYNKIVDECIYGDDKQKPAWSEETDDDAWMNDIISKVENNLQLNKAEIDWLKSLKQRIGG